MTEHTHTTTEPKRTNPTVLIVAVILALGIAAGIAAQTLDDVTLAALAGAICSACVSIPTTLLIAAIARRRGERSNTTLHVPTQPQHAPAQPTILVMGAQPFQWPTNSLQPPHLTAPVERTFTTIGDDPEPK